MSRTRTTGQSKWALAAALQHMQMLLCKSCHLPIVSEGQFPACPHSRTQHVLTSNSVQAFRRAYCAFQPVHIQAFRRSYNMLRIAAQQNSGRLDGSQCGLCHQHSTESILGMHLGDFAPSGLECREGVLQRSAYGQCSATSLRYNLKGITLHAGRLNHLAI